MTAWTTPWRSVFATLKRELVHRAVWTSREDVTRAQAEYIEGWYNRARRHSPLGYLSPLAYEDQVMSAA